jgi:hypothetical protein
VIEFQVIQRLEVVVWRNSSSTEYFTALYRALLSAP